MLPLGVHHVSLNVRDVDEALDFYVGALGMVIRSDRPDFSFGGAWLNVGSEQVHLIQGPPPEPKGQHFAVRVADLSAVVGELRAKGLNVSEPVSVNASLQSFVTDPSGNIVELHQVG